ncbi:DUF4358 domain-containing protein [Parablautia muri]|uniref:DUF4358 domain-containing protein n=1 Tax=Parablautia muri TaxID=2320879 RepID=A0A9X5BIG3_9FIRM|nr:DUF4358 domain-containing protein [Parablautia muri]NBJ94217.1 DUF4358 domain-containing protein [Parablautia muri]
MKKNNFFLIVLSTFLFLTGCVDKNKNDESHAFVDEGNGEEDAINTLQVGSKYKIVGPMDELKDAVMDILDSNYWPDTLLSSEELAERTGISENMYDDYMAEYQHTEAGIDMMIIVKAKEGQIQTVEQYLNEYRELLLNIYSNQPQNRAKIFASRIETIENYVCYIQLGANLSPFEKNGDEAMIYHCQQENERALDIIEKRILNT